MNEGVKQSREIAIIWLFAVAWLVPVLTIARATAATPAWDEMLRHVPATAELVLAVENPSEFSSSFAATELGQLLKGPVFAPYRDSLEEAGIATILNPRPAWGLEWSDWAEIQDPALIACIPLESGEAGWLGLVIPGHPLEAAPRWLTQAKRHGLSQGWDVSEREVGQWRVSTISSAGREENEIEGEPLQWTLFWGPDRCGWVSDQRLLDGVFSEESEESAGSAASLDENLQVLHWLTEQRQPPKTDVDGNEGDVPLPSTDRAKLFFVARPFQLAETLAGRKDSPREHDDLTDPWARAERLGLTRIGTVVGQVTLSPGSAAELVLDARTIPPHPLTGALQLGAVQSGLTDSLLPWLDPSMVATQSWRWDFPTAMRGWGALFDELTEPGPDGVGLFDDLLLGMRDDPTGPRVDLRGDLFPNLGPVCELAWFRGDQPEGLESAGVAREGPFSRSLRGLEGIAATRDNDNNNKTNPPSVDGWLLITECRDEEKVRDLLERFYASDQQVTRQLQGDIVLWTVSPGNSLFVVGESEETPNIRALASGQGHLLFATEPRLLELGLGAGTLGSWREEQPPGNQAKENHTREKQTQQEQLPVKQRTGHQNNGSRDSRTDGQHDSRLLDDPPRVWLTRRRSENTAWMGIYREAMLWQAAYEQARLPATRPSGTSTGAKVESREGSDGDSWNVSLWDWLLFGNASPEVRSALHAPPAAEHWQHIGDRQAAVLNLLDDQWQLEGAVFPRRSSHDEEP
jgi:hypothetical protein